MLAKMFHFNLIKALKETSSLQEMQGLGELNVKHQKETLDKSRCGTFSKTSSQDFSESMPYTSV